MKLLPQNRQGLRSSIKSLEPVAFDTETTGLEMYRADEVFAFSTQKEDGRQAVLRLDREPRKFWRELNALFASTQNVLIMHNAKFDLSFVIESGVRVRWLRPIHDTLLMAKVLRSNLNSFALKELCYTLAGYPREDESDVKESIRGVGGYDTAPDYIMDKYQKCDVDRTMLLYTFMWPKIKKDKKLLAIYELELALLWVAIKMERTGVYVAQRSLVRLREQLENEAEKIEQRFPKGGTPDTAAWLINWLYEIEGLPVLRRTQKTKQPSTDKRTLLELREKFPKCRALDDTLRWRSRRKGVVTLDSYAYKCDEHGILHTNINTYGSKTGRQSSDNPNLMNIAKEFNPANPYPIPARRVFRPRPGHVAFLIDYAGQEARLIINASRDKGMIKIMRSDNPDPHAAFARVFYKRKFTHEKDARIKKGLRDRSKSGFFAFAYGAGASKLVRVFDLKRKQVERGLREVSRKFPGIAKLNKARAETSKELGYIETSFGRRIYIDGGKYYAALNAEIQGTGADLLKIAQVRVEDFFHHDLKDKWFIVLTVHDELIIEAPRDDLPKAKEVLAEVRKLMIDFPQFSIPLEVEISIATVSWARKREYSIKEQ